MPPTNRIETHSEALQSLEVLEYEKLSGAELLDTKGLLLVCAQNCKWWEDDGVAREISKKIESINALLPSANFRNVTLPEGGLEILPGLNLIHCGKVRNTFAHPTNPERLIIVATDRISTHDVVHKNPIPGKGEAITAVSNRWFDIFAEDEATKHIPTQRALSANGTSEPLPDILQGKWLESKTIIVKKLRALPIEAIVRGYLYGSALKEYNAETGKLGTGEHVGTGLFKCSQFSEPLFTPSTKGEKDVNIDFDGMVDELHAWFIENGLVQKNASQTFAYNTAEQIREYSLALYATANKYAQSKWLTLADTKFEFALDADGHLVLIDEVCTPDSSRFWTTTSIVEWQEPEQFDKQAVRDWVAAEWKRTGTEKTKPPLTIPDEIIAIAQGKYGEIKNKFSTTSAQVQDTATWAVEWILGA